GVAQSFVEGDVGGEAEEFSGAAVVDPATRLPVRFGTIPAQLPVETGDRSDAFGEIGDRHLFIGAEVDGFGTVVAFRGFQDPPGGIIDVEKFAAGRARAPQLDVVGAG